MTDNKLLNTLYAHAAHLHSLFQPALNPSNTCMMDFSSSNKDLQALDLSDTARLNRYVFDQIHAAGALYGFGGYMEDREVYRRSTHFSAGDGPPRSIHLGVDIWTREETPVHLPLDGKIHSFQVNATYGDYGPTIIVEHQLAGQTFFSLYGHLSMQSLDGLHSGMELAAGEAFCRIGDSRVNGDWPPHLHFQLITDMQGKMGDFPGVCLAAERDKYRELCPSPAVFFQYLEE